VQGAVSDLLDNDALLRERLDDGRRHGGGPMKPRGPHDTAAESPTEARGDGPNATAPQKAALSPARHFSQWMYTVPDERNKIIGYQTEVIRTLTSSIEELQKELRRVHRKATQANRGHDQVGAAARGRVPRRKPARRR
jgi:hypothetical protein